MAAALTAGPVSGLHLTHSMTSSVRHNASNTNRPKLSLQTTSLPITFGKSSTALSRAPSTSSPTTYNTFTNAYEVTSTSAPARPSQSSRGLRLSTTTAFNNKEQTAEVPYHLPLDIKSVLKNSLHPQHYLTKESPLSATLRRRPSFSLNVTPSPYRSSPLGHYSPGFCTPAAAERPYVFFPVMNTKRVSFRQSLDEEVVTVTYVARHSDLYESDDEVEQSRPQREETPGPQLEMDIDIDDLENESSQSDDILDQASSDTDTDSVISRFSSIASLSDDEHGSSLPKLPPSVSRHNNHVSHHRDYRASLIDKLHRRTADSRHFNNKIDCRRAKKRHKLAHLNEAFDFIEAHSQTTQPITSIESETQIQAQPEDTTGYS